MLQVASVRVGCCAGVEVSEWGFPNHLPFLSANPAELLSYNPTPGVSQKKASASALLKVGLTR